MGVNVTLPKSTPGCCRQERWLLLTRVCHSAWLSAVHAVAFGAGNDSVSGDAGDDTLDGGAGACWGQRGRGKRIGSQHMGC